jgi:hypothetical protein
MSTSAGPLRLVSTTGELLARKSSGSGLESREYGRRDTSCRPRGTLYPQKLALTSPISGGRSVGIVRSRTQATEFSFVYFSSDEMGRFSRGTENCNMHSQGVITFGIRYMPNALVTRPMSKGFLRLRYAAVSCEQRIEVLTAHTTVTAPPLSTVTSSPWYKHTIHY